MRPIEFAGLRSPDGSWPALHEAMIDEAIRMRDVMRPHLHEIEEELDDAG